jgi:hypothetical protein
MIFSSRCFMLQWHKLRPGLSVETCLTRIICCGEEVCYVSQCFITCIGLLKLPGASNVKDLQADTSKHIRISVGSIFNKSLLPDIGVRTLQELETSVQYCAPLPPPPPQSSTKGEPLLHTTHTLHSTRLISGRTNSSRM